MPNRYRSGNGVSSALLPAHLTTIQSGEPTLASMVTRIRKGARVHLYMQEHRKAKELSVQEVAGRIVLEEAPDGVSRETVWRWEKEQWRLTTEKIGAYADALGLEDWTELTRMPDRPSLDAIVRDAPAEVHQMAVDIVRRLAGRSN